MPILREQRNVNVTGADVQLAPGQMQRVALIIGAPKAQTIWLSFVGPAAVGVGIPLRPGQLPLTLTRDVFAEALIEEVRAISEGTAENIGVIDLFG